MQFRDVLEVQGVKAKGFGIIPKLAMLDRELTIEAKAIYSYFCSYAGAGTTAFPSREKICKDLGIGKNRYYKHFNLLKELGYIKVKQVKKEDSKFSHNIYTLVENPIKIESKQNSVEVINSKANKGKSFEENVDKIPCTQNRDTEKNQEKPCIHFGDTENGDTQNRDTNNNRSFINNNNVFYNHQSVSPEESNKKEPVGQTDRQIENIENILEKIKESLEIESLKTAYPGEINLINEIMLNIFDMYFSEYTIIKGDKKPKELIRAVIMKLTYFHIEALINKFNEISTSVKIKNNKAYMQSMIYNIVFENDLAITNDIKYNFF